MKLLYKIMKEIAPNTFSDQGFFTEDKMRETFGVFQTTPRVKFLSSKSELLIIEYVITEESLNKTQDQVWQGD